MKAITAPASDTYVPISTARPVSPTSIRNATIVPIATVDSVTPSRSASNHDPTRLFAHIKAAITSRAKPIPMTMRPSGTLKPLRSSVSV